MSGVVKTTSDLGSRYTGVSNHSRAVVQAAISRSKAAREATGSSAPISRMALVQCLYIATGGHRSHLSGSVDEAVIAAFDAWVIVVAGNQNNDMFTAVAGQTFGDDLSTIVDSDCSGHVHV